MYKIESSWTDYIMFNIHANKTSLLIESVNFEIVMK